MNVAKVEDAAAAEMVEFESVAKKVREDPVFIDFRIAQSEYIAKSDFVLEHSKLLELEER